MPELSPAERLEGLELDDGWHVDARVAPQPGATGGHFSCCYRVTGRDGRRGFLKALDFSPALSSEDPPRALLHLTAAYVFERDLLQQCDIARMDRVVRVIASGKAKVDGSLIGDVPYLIFEGADRDLRSQIRMAGTVETAWRLRSLHHIATGLFQLHRREIAHQDLKPSNVLLFPEGTRKVSDLGCASVRGGSAPRDGSQVPGDRGYAPPEALYGHAEADWTQRRIGCDVYLLGSMVFFLFSGLTATALLLAHLADELRPETWSGTYNDVLPYLREAFGRALETFSDCLPDGELGEELLACVSELCDPEPARRRHPASTGAGFSRLVLERYVSLFDRLARRAEIGWRP